MNKNLKDLGNLRLLIDRKLLFCRVSLFIEKLLSSSQHLLLLLGIFIIIVIYNLLPLLPKPIHYLILLAYGIYLLSIIVITCIRLKIPTIEEARNRLEKKSNINHRPLTAWEDNLGYDASANENRIWLEHKIRMKNLIKKLNPTLPSPIIAKIDPFGIRALFLILITFGILSAGEDLKSRIFLALNPNYIITEHNISIQIWFDPPRYMQLPNKVVNNFEDNINSESMTEIPKGSKLLTIIHGAKEDIEMHIDKSLLLLEKIGDRTHRFEGELNQGKKIIITYRNKIIGLWNIKILKDKKPEIVLEEIQDNSYKHYLEINLLAQDDYGLKSIIANISPLNKESLKINNLTSDFPISYPSDNPKYLENKSFHNLSAHPLAGEIVNLTLFAEDLAKNKASSNTTKVKIPERKFLNPTAAHIIKLRKGLINNTSSMLEARNFINNITQKPETYNNDLTLHLALNSLKNRLAILHDYESIREIIDIMWKIAIRIEDGVKGRILDEIIEAQQQLSKAILNNESHKIINSLINKLKSDIRDYYKKNSYQEYKTDIEKPFKIKKADSYTQKEINQILEAMRELKDIGSKELSQRLISNLEKLISKLDSEENLYSESLNQMKLNDLIPELESITRNQSKLLELSFRNTQFDSKNKNEIYSAAEKQNEIIKGLNEFMKKLNKISNNIPSELEYAPNEMESARKNLKNLSWRKAYQSQAKAVSYLRYSLSDLGTLIKNKSNSKTISGKESENSENNNSLNYDNSSFGLFANEPLDISIKNFNKGMAEKSRKILKEIRRRSNERKRSKEELEYLKRLLNSF